MSRTVRAARTLGSRMTALFDDTTSSQEADLQDPASRRLQHTKATNRNASHHDTYSDAEFPDHRANKRRKLEIRGPRQSTLDSFLNSNIIPRPPVKIAASRPNGSVVETVNGVKTELPTSIDAILDNGAYSEYATTPPKAAAKRLKTAAAQAQKREEKRTLRSQDDGPRLKSELATYFGNYEEIIFDTPREPELLNVDTSIYIVDDAATKPIKGATPSPKSVKSVKSSPSSSRYGLSTLQQPSQPRLGAVELDLSSLMQTLSELPDDPLTDDAFSVSHRRAERKEKQMRNIEREHAMHEKLQLDRLLDGLLGHDWLRVLGITGVTETEAKKFEPKRDYFVEEVRTLIAKFNAWKEEEKRQKYEREALLAAEREAEDETSTEVSSVEPASSELNLSASRQLQQETASAMKTFSAPRTKRKERLQVPPSPVPYRPPSPLTSFYPSRHLRESALKKARNSRNTTAFGLPLPEVPDQEFCLPSDYITEDVLRASARERRRKKRESVANAVAKPP